MERNYLMKAQIALGIVGSAGRGGSFKRSCDALETFRIAAVCDTNREGLEQSKAALGVERGFTDYDEMLDQGKVDAVIIGTPMPLHVPQALAAIQRGIHVISEVPAGVDIDECRELVRACKASKAVYMMAENYTYTQTNQVVAEMVRRGEFGTPYYAEGEYIHELKELNGVTKWRRKWQTGINGITYGTHSLGPILMWFWAHDKADRITSVCCAGSGHHYQDPRGDEYENEDSCVMLCKFKNNGLAKVRVDMLSERPSAMTNYSLQGTGGCYESARGGGERHRVWLKNRAKDHAWSFLDDLQAGFMPDHWVKYEELAQKAGHGGGDLIELIDFSDAILGKRATPIGIHEAMDMTLPGLVSQQSIQRGGAWMDVPDSRGW
jgi:predicted dehydrogenase